MSRDLLINKLYIGQIMVREKPVIQLSFLCRIAKAHLGYGSKDNVSPYDMVSQVLVNNGVERRPGEGAKKFVIRNIEFLRNLSGASKVIVKPQRETDGKSEKITAKLPKPKALRRVEILGREFIMSAEFYDSREWKQLRYQALKLHGALCQCCGAGRKDGTVLHVDHILPRSVDWKSALEIDNLQVLCKDCNLGKSNWDATDWRGK